jgi:hypothetical protein
MTVATLNMTVPLLLVKAGAQTSRVRPRIGRRGAGSYQQSLQWFLGCRHRGPLGCHVGAVVGPGETLPPAVLALPISSILAGTARSGTTLHGRWSVPVQVSFMRPLSRRSARVVPGAVPGRVPGLRPRGDGDTGGAVGALVPASGSRRSWRTKATSCAAWPAPPRGDPMRDGASRTRGTWSAIRARPRGSRNSAWTRSPSRRRTTRSDPPPRGADVQREDYERGEASNLDLTEFVP